MKAIKLLSIFFFLLWILMKLNGPSETLDNHFFYTGREATHFFETRTDAQLDAYFRKELIDLVYMVIYGSLFVLILRKVRFRWPRLGMLPMFFDSIETSSILCIVSAKSFYLNLDWLGWVTCLKWITVVLVIAVAAYESWNSSSSRE